MKSLIGVFLLLLSSATNDIDFLKCNDDVQDFLVKKVYKGWKGTNFFGASGGDTSVYGKNGFLKLDLNNDGHTDLLINGEYFFAVTADGNEKYSTHFIDRGAFTLDKYTLTDIIYKDKTPLIVIKRFAREPYRITPQQDTTKKDTLLLKFGQLIEYNSSPDKFSINEINFKTLGCFGSCPVFEMSIKASGISDYNAINYNDKKGRFKTRIDTASFNKLCATINYLNLRTIKDSYSVGWTDDRTMELEIKYNNGEVKKIQDYGGIGTFGLQNLYSQFYALRTTQKWKE